MAQVEKIKADRDILEAAVLGGAVLGGGGGSSIEQKKALGAGLRDPALLRPVEKTLGKEIVKYGRWT